MSTKPIKCTNCGKISQRGSILPLCNECAKGLEDYERQIIDSLVDIHINIDKTPKTVADGFLKM
jgi:hypothetical protein